MAGNGRDPGAEPGKPARALAHQCPLRRREQPADLAQVPVHPAGQAADIGSATCGLPALVQAPEQHASLPVCLPLLPWPEPKPRDRLAGHSRNDHDQEFGVRSGQLRGAPRPERPRPAPQGGHFPRVKAARGMALEVPAPAAGAGQLPYRRAVPLPGTVGHVSELPRHLARQRGERPRQIRHSLESSHGAGRVGSDTRKERLPVPARLAQVRDPSLRLRWNFGGRP